MTPPRIANTRYATVSVGEITEHPRNPRRGDVDSIAGSLDANGFFGTIVVQESTGHVLVGNHRLRAAVAAGMAEVPVSFVDVDDETALRIMLADNRTAELATNDDAALAAILSDLAESEGLAGTGYADDDLEALLRFLAAGPDAERLPAEEAWAGMPEYTSENLESTFKTSVHFRTHEDADRFFELLGRKKTFAIWWPESDGHVGCFMREQYVDDAAPEPEE